MNNNKDIINRNVYKNSLGGLYCYNVKLNQDDSEIVSEVNMNIVRDLNYKEEAIKSYYLKERGWLKK